MRQEDIQFLQNLQTKLLQADNDPKMNDCQANPRFWVVLENKLVPTDEEHGKSYILNGECAQPLTLKEFVDMIDDEVEAAKDAELLKSWNNTDKIFISRVLTFVNEQLGWHDVHVAYFEEQDAIVENTFFLTKEAAQKHIEANHHHYRNPHTYAMTAWRSPEFERFFNLFKQFDFTAASKTIDKACEVLHKTGTFELMAAQEGMSAACMEDQFRKTIEELS